MRKRIGRAIVMLVLICGGAALVIWRISLLAPSWYNPPNPADPNVAAVADAVEYHIVEQAQKNRSDEKRWAIRLTEGQANAWLGARLRKWVEHRREFDWPAEFGVPQAHFEPGRISVALPVNHDGSERTLVLGVQPQMDGERLTLALDRVAVGRIELPGEPVANMLEELTHAAPDAFDDPDWHEAIDALAQRRAIDPVFELADGRRIRLLALRVADGHIDVTAVTLDVGE